LAAPQDLPADTHARAPLAEALVTLAGTPDDSPSIDAQLKMLARLAADRVRGVDYASITAVRDGAKRHGGRQVGPTFIGIDTARCR
jgi:hypothetical protein